LSILLMECIKEDKWYVVQFFIQRMWKFLEFVAERHFRLVITIFAEKRMMGRCCMWCTFWVKTLICIEVKKWINQHVQNNQIVDTDEVASEIDTSFGFACNTICDQLRCNKIYTWWILKQMAEEYSCLLADILSCWLVCKQCNGCTHPLITKDLL
jgi:hypothetical protein